MLKQCPLSARTRGSGNRLLRSPGMKVCTAVAAVFLGVGAYADPNYYQLR
jgi:hypothetical protein